MDMLVATTANRTTKKTKTLRKDFYENDLIKVYGQI